MSPHHLHTALLIVDIQIGFLHRAPPSLMPAILALCQTGILPHVLASEFINADGSPFVRFLGWRGLCSTEEQSIPPELRPHVSRTFRKSGYSAVTHELHAYLESHQVERLAICGMDTDGCLLATATDLFSNGIEPIVLTDCSASTGGSELHEYALAILRRSIGSSRVVSVAEFARGGNLP